MNKIFYVAGGAVAVLIIVLVWSGTGLDTKTFSYTDANANLKTKLAEHQISVSSPIKLKEQKDIDEFCSFFKNPDLQKLVQYCTSTELKDQTGAFLGNIHMVGPPDSPKIILTLLQSDKTMSNLNTITTVFESVIQNTVCDCWQQERPGGIPNVSQWVDGLRQFHLGDTKPHSKSKEVSLGDKTLQLELTENQDGYLWQLFIYA
jgi:hypothetical protein